MRPWEVCTAGRNSPQNLEVQVLWHRKSLATSSCKSPPARQLRLPLLVLLWVIPVVITVYADRSFSFITKTPPAPVLIKKAAGIDTASGVPNKNKVGSITLAQAEEIAKTKMPDLNAASLEAAVSMIKGTARSMGVTVEG